MHNHDHSCVCKHDNVRYCSHCGTVYCLGCNREWGVKPYWNWSTYYQPPYQYTTGLLTTTSGGNPNVASQLASGNFQQASQVTCDHKS